MRGYLRHEALTVEDVAEPTDAMAAESDFGLRRQDDAASRRLEQLVLVQQHLTRVVSRQPPSGDDDPVSELLEVVQAEVDHRDEPGTVDQLVLEIGPGADAQVLGVADHVLGEQLECGDVSRGGGDGATEQGSSVLDRDTTLVIHTLPRLLPRPLAELVLTPSSGSRPT